MQNPTSNKHQIINEGRLRMTKNQEILTKKKITKATFRSFCSRNKGKLLIRCDSSFDGMIDCVSFNHDAQFKPARYEAGNDSHTLGILGVWLVGHSRDYFEAYEQDGMICLSVYNCCGSFVVACKN